MQRCSLEPLSHHSAETQQKRCFNGFGAHLICLVTLTTEIVMDHQEMSISNAFRKPRRVSITIPHATYSALVRRSYEQGRSISNLSAYLLECAVNDALPPQLQ